MLRRIYYFKGKEIELFELMIEIQLMLEREGNAQSWNELGIDYKDIWEE